MLTKEKPCYLFALLTMGNSDFGVIDILFTGYISCYWLSPLPSIIRKLHR